MCDVFVMLNPDIRYSEADRIWLEPGERLQLNQNHSISLIRVRSDDTDTDQLLLIETLNDQQLLKHQVQNGAWVLLPTRQGWLEIIPKAVKIGLVGQSLRLLVDLRLMADRGQKPTDRKFHGGHQS